MKAAIVGLNPIGLEMAIALTDLEADFRIYSEDLEYWKSKSNSQTLMFGNWKETTSMLGRKLTGKEELLNEDYLSKVPTEAEYLNNYFVPILNNLELEKKVISTKAKRIQKRFLSKNEQVEGKSRLIDLFRITHSIDPINLIKEGQKNNPEIYSKFDDSMLSSLKGQYESYIDYDLIFNCSEVLSAPAKAGTAGHLAVGEDQLSNQDERVLYCSKVNEISSKLLLNSKQITLVGTDIVAAELCEYFKDWIVNPEHHLTIITDNINPFNYFHKSKYPRHQLAFDKVTKLLETAKNIDQENLEIFESKLKEWNASEPYIQAKLGRPVPPRKKVELFSGWNCTAVMAPTDQEQVFITIERPPFRKIDLPYDHLKDCDLITLKADKLLISNGVRSSQLEDLLSGLNISLESNDTIFNSEPGYYQLGSNHSSQVIDYNSLAKLNEIPVIIENMFNFFRRNE